MVLRGAASSSQIDISSVQAFKLEPEFLNGSNHQKSQKSLEQRVEEEAAARQTEKDFVTFNDHEANEFVQSHSFDQPTHDFSTHER